MNDFIDFFIPVFASVLISFILIFYLFGVTVDRIENLEKYHSNVCSECGQIIVEK